MKDNLFLKRYYAALRHYKWVAFACFAIISAIAWEVANLRSEPEVVYAVQGTLLYQPSREVASADGQPAIAQKPVVSLEFLTSSRILELTARMLKAQRQEVTPEVLRNQVKLERDPNQENRFLIQHQGNDAHQAELVVASITNTIINQSLIDQRKEAEIPIKQFSERKKQLVRNLHNAETALREFGRQKKPAIQAAVDGSLVSAITNIQQQRRQLHRELEGIDAEIASIQTQMTQIQNQMGMTPEQLYIVSAVSADSTIAGLRTKIDEIKSQIEQQRRELQPKHPDIVALQRQQQVHETQLQTRFVEISGDRKSTPLVRDVAEIRRASDLDQSRKELTGKLANLRTQRNRMAQELSILSRSEPEIRRNYNDGTELELELEKHTNEVARYREALDQNEKQLETATLKKAETRSDWVSDGSPQVNEVRNWYLSRPFLLVVGGGIGILGAGLVVLILDALRGKILIPEEVEAILEQRAPLLGILPLIPMQESKTKIPFLTELDSIYLEPYELLRSSLLRNSLHRRSRGQSPKVVMLSSTQDGEGKTVSAYNLAIASARAGKKTLLIEANLRTSSQVQILGVPLDETEKLGSLAEHLQISSVQAVPNVKNLFVWASPGSMDQVTEIIESNLTQELLNKARADFDFVVIDSTALKFSDTLLIEPFTDGLVLVTRPNYTDRSSLRIVIEKLANYSDIKFLGVILNRVTTSPQFVQ
jgi:capsular exopolysaccharide synthesis family protein